jgi:4-hydroxybenzoyl-CoA thioesterase
MTYTRIMPVEFNHCDPAGIVFYPRYFEMTNSLVENFFADVVEHSYGAMMDAGQGVPTARLEVNFKAPSRLGEKLEWRLEVVSIGGSSVSFVAIAMVADQFRLTADLTLVWVEAGKPAPWPDAMRAKLKAFQGGTA